MVVETDPVADHTTGVLQRLEAVAVCALVFERADDAHRKRLALGALRRIQKLPNLVRSFFRHNECLYARM